MVGMKKMRASKNTADKMPPNAMAITGKESIIEIEKVLLKWFELAEPDDVPFLQFESLLIAREIASRLGLPDDPHIGGKEGADAYPSAY